MLEGFDIPDPMATVPRSLQPDSLSTLMLDWYDRNRRILPWRAPPGERPDPYGVWLSEIMLQQTTVATVGPYWGAFMAKWPQVQDLATATLDEVLHLWQGLGYYARARNLHACAKAVAALPGGQFPDTEAGLLKLPGIGAYTAAAIAAIAFDRNSVVLDGNIERVMARMFAVETPLPAAKPELRAHAATLTPDRRPGDYAQAVMDLGASICTPRKPRCLLCPWREPCAAHAAGDPERFPAKREKPARPVRRGIAFWLVRPDGTVLLRRRPEEGLLGGMMEIPSTPWRAEPWDEAEAAPFAPVKPRRWQALPGLVGHTFTHFHLELAVLVGRVDPVATGTLGLWLKPDRFGEQALPTAMKKVVRHVLAGLR
jgi:A/G-specific adenine glycosylase